MCQSTTGKVTEAGVKSWTRLSWELSCPFIRFFAYKLLKLKAWTGNSCLSQPQPKASTCTMEALMSQSRECYQCNACRLLLKTFINNSGIPSQDLVKTNPRVAGCVQGTELVWKATSIQTTRRKLTLNKTQFYTTFNPTLANGNTPFHNKDNFS